MHKISEIFFIISVATCFAGDFVPNQSGMVLGADLKEALLDMDMDIKGQDTSTTHHSKLCVDSLGKLLRVGQFARHKLAGSSSAVGSGKTLRAKRFTLHLWKHLSRLVLNLFGTNLTTPCCRCTASGFATGSPAGRERASGFTDKIDNPEATIFLKKLADLKTFLNKKRPRGIPVPWSLSAPKNVTDVYTCVLHKLSNGCKDSRSAEVLLQEDASWGGGSAC